MQKDNNWIALEKGECPVKPGTIVDVRLHGNSNFDTLSLKSTEVCWDEETTVTHYRVVSEPMPDDFGQQNVIGSDELPLSEKYPKYHKSVTGLDSIDVYRVHDLFNVTEPAIHHASKKLLMAGDRTGEKSMEDDIREARDTLTRWLDMKAEDGS